MSDELLNLFDFGTNNNGEYVNLVEEEKKLKDINIKEFQKWLSNHNDPLIRIAFDLFIGAIEFETAIYTDLQTKLENIIETKCYHYGNFAKHLYIFSLHYEDRYMMIFENSKHYLGYEPQLWKLEHESYGNLVDVAFDDYLLGKATIVFPALHCPCYDLKGNRINDYYDKEYQKDIRHIVCIKEWQMEKYSQNRMHESKKIKDFYEVEFTLPNLIDYWGESNVEDSDE